MLRIERLAERGINCNLGGPDGPGHGERNHAHEWKSHPKAGGTHGVRGSRRPCHGHNIQRPHRRGPEGGCRGPAGWPRKGGHCSPAD